MSEREGQQMEMQVVVDTEGAWTELGAAGGGDIAIYVEGHFGNATATWTREEAWAVYDRLGELLDQ